jgi:hypothetical protein
MRDKGPCEVLAETLLDELTVHLFRQKAKSSSKQTHAALRAHSDGSK